ncbi:TPA: P-loop NTPase [Stenotrophomonas maltophilia]|nr:P-loop NTPase [Stenotrophomonas maltophilia]
MNHVSVVSPKGGVGKTMLALQLAASFARDGVRVFTVVDARGIPHLAKAKNEIALLRTAVDAAIAQLTPSHE